MWFVAFVASWIISGIVNAMIGEDERADEGGLQVNPRSTSEIVPLIYGRIKTKKINTPYMASGGNENKYVFIIGEIGEGPIHGIVRQDGSTFTSAGTQFPGTNPPLLYLDGELWTDKWGPDFVYAEFFKGTAAQGVCSTLHAAKPEWNDPKRHTAYIFLRLKYDLNKWVTVPKISLVVDGLEVFDPAAATVGFSDNFALMAYDMLTRPSTRGGLGLDAWFGPVPESPRVNVASVEAARAYCEAKGWTGGLIIDEDQYFSENFQLVLNCFRGEAINSDNQVKIKFRDLNYETPVIDITEADFVEKDGRTTLKIRPTADLFDLPNAIDAVFYNADKRYAEDTFVKTDQDAVASDGDLRKLTKRIPGLNTLAKLQPMANYYLERARFGHLAEGSLADRFFALEAVDVVRLTHSMPGWVDRYMRVRQVGVGAGNVVSIELEEELQTLYDDAYNPSQITWYRTTLPDPTAEVPSVINAAIEEELYSFRGRSYTRLVIGFDQPAGYPFWGGRGNLVEDRRRRRVGEDDGQP